MINYSTMGARIKGKVLGFCEKCSRGLSKPMRKFVADMIYGIMAAGDCKLTEISRALKESITLRKTVDRLGRNLADFGEGNAETVMENYLDVIRPSLRANTMLLIDSGDVTKPCSLKMEGIGTVYDGSKGTYGDGYWTMGAVALTENGQPVPVYENLYPCNEEGGFGFNAETKKCVESLRKNFGPENPRLFDRGFDVGWLLQELIRKNEKFILRQNQNRVAIHNGRKAKVEDIVRGLVCTHEMKFHSKTGNISKCKIGMTQITLPGVENLKVNLVVCKDFGEKPLVLYTNLCETVEEVAVRVVKGYLMRWRIEEFYAFKKQELNFEDFRVRSLNSIKTLDLLLTIAAGHIGLLCAKVNQELFVADLIFASRRLLRYNVFVKETKVFYSAIHNGITAILATLRNGIAHFFSTHTPSAQLSFFPLLEKMG